MSDEWSWRDFAAIWGALLSTVLALSGLLRKWPVFHVEPGDEPVSDLTLRIVNPSDKMVFVREKWRSPVPFWSEPGPIGVYTEKSRVCDVEVPGTLWLAIKGGDERQLRIIYVRSDEQPVNGRWVLVFLWRRAWPPIWLPGIVFISTHFATGINAAK